ncbi:MAG: ribose 5-phosphate isomerase A [Spirochaetes bacterium]|nr:ribose 5-phosphate isomerase A [Spirochaetota bacterium]
MASNKNGPKQNSAAASAGTSAPGGADSVKELLGRTAADEFVRSGMRVGLGTGSTAIWAIRRIAEGIAEGSLTGILGVATSTQSAFAAEEGDIPLRSMNDPEIDGELDVIIDGADEIDEGRNLTKGGGAALLIEKILAYNAERVVIIAGRGKYVARLGVTYPIPIEVVREARRTATRSIEALGGRCEVRQAQRKMGPVITDNGNILLDTTFADGISDPKGLEGELNLIPGVVENGIFSRIRPLVLIGEEDGSITRLG